jgi:hypothetical protein
MIEILPLASGSKGNCYRITDGRAPLLLECGIPFREIQKGLNFRTSELAGVLVSHEHKDHSKAVRDMMKAGIDCYMSQGTAEALRVSGHRLHIVKAKQQFRVGTWTILPFDTVHDASEPLGFLLASGKEKLLFATDTSYIRYRFKGLTHIMIEANYQREILEHGVEEGLVPVVVRNRTLFLLSALSGMSPARNTPPVSRTPHTASLPVPSCTRRSSHPAGCECTSCSLAVGCTSHPSHTRHRSETGSGVPTPSGSPSAPPSALHIPAIRLLVSKTSSSLLSHISKIRPLPHSLYFPDAKAREKHERSKARTFPYHLLFLFSCRSVLDIPEFWSGNDFNFLEQFGRLGIQFPSSLPSALLFVSVVHTFP